jgi:glycosyltransferase involved in cell wall biosynthesis
MYKRKKKICIVATITLPLNNFMVSHIAALSDHYDIVIVANGSKDDLTRLSGINFGFVCIPIQRKIAVWSDLKCLFKLVLLFSRSKFTAVHSVMPKSGLLAMVAASLVCVPVRIHTFTGQVWASKNGIKRFGLKYFDKLLAACATTLITDSHPQREFLVQQGVCSKDKINVLGPGSMAGVDLNRFKLNLADRSKIRQKLEIPKTAFIYLFLGRLNRDKGVIDLALAFTKLTEQFENAYLLFVGVDEENLREKISELLGVSNKKVRFVDWTNEPEAYMSAADTFCLPSYREGFPSTVLEAAAVGIPTICSRIYGTQDAVIDGVTGLMHPPGDVPGIKHAMENFLVNKELHAELSVNARDRIKTFFAREILIDAMEQFYANHVG